MNKFLKVATWRQIIQSRIVYYKNREKDWYKDRRNICDVCPLNSKNKKELSLKDKIFRILNLKSHFCTICKCPIHLITSLEESECSLYEVNKEPKWKSNY